MCIYAYIWHILHVMHNNIWGLMYTPREPQGLGSNGITSRYQSYLYPDICLPLSSNLEPICTGRRGDSHTCFKLDAKVAGTSSVSPQYPSNSTCSLYYHYPLITARLGAASQKLPIPRHGAICVKASRKDSELDLHTETLYSYQQSKTYKEQSVTLK